MRKYIVFGLGEEKSIGRYVIDKLSQKGDVVEYILDNRSEEIDYRGIPIKKPDYLMEINKSEYFVIVTTLRERESMMLQLEDYGLKRGIDFLHIKKMPEIYDENEFIGYRFGELLPEMVRIELSSRCNLQCEFCFYHGRELEESTRAACNENMSFDVIKRIVQQVNKIPTIKNINNCEKGEIFCNPQWFEMCQYIAENSHVKRFIFHTNGMLLTTENVSKLLKLKFEFIQVIFSIDGRTAEENDTYRRNSKFVIIEKNIKYLLENMDERFDVQIQNAFLATREEIDRWNKGEVFKNQWLEEVFDRKIKYLSMPFLANVGKQYDHGNENLCKTYDVYLEKFSNVYGDGCSLPFREISIDAFGNMNVCSCARSYISLGSIFEEDILLKWRTDKVLSKMREQYTNGENVIMCKGCFSDKSRDSYYHLFVKKSV